MSDARTARTHVSQKPRDMGHPFLIFQHTETILKEGKMAGEKINPEAAQPSTVQDFAYSDRNPAVTGWGENGGQVETPAASEGRVTPEGAAVSPDAGLQY